MDHQPGPRQTEILSRRMQEELRDERLAFTTPLDHSEVALMVSDLENSWVSSSITRPCMLQVPELGPWS